MFRDSTIVIVETGRTVVRAGRGIPEILKAPTVETPARVGLRRDTFNNMVYTSPTDQGSTSTAFPVSSLPGFTCSSAKVNDYLVGQALEDALAAGQDVALSWPFADGGVRDWTQAEALWKFTLFTGLSLRRLQNESPVILSIPVGLPRSSIERICQIFFERLNVAGFSIIERPLSQLYAANSLSGVVVDIGTDRTDVTPVYEGTVLRNARSVVPLGIQDCENHLASIFSTNQKLVGTLATTIPHHEIPQTLVALAQYVWQEGHVKIPSHGEVVAPMVDDEGVVDLAAIVLAGKEKSIVESNLKKRNNAKASAAEQARAREIEALDLITIQFRGHSLVLGKERHRFCEPLFDPRHATPSGEQPKGLQDAVGYSIGLADVKYRQYIWGGLYVTGELSTRVPGIPTALQTRLKPYVVGNAFLETDSQARSVRLLNVPEYFSEYKERDMTGEWRHIGNGLSAFLGATIVAKITANDNHGKSFVTKADYTAIGPHSIIEFSPSLL